MPTVRLSADDISQTGLRVVDLLVKGGLCKSKSDARRMIESGAVFAGDAKVDDVSAAIDPAKLEEGVILKKGKKGFVRILKA